MKTYTIQIDAITIEAENEGDAAAIYMERIEDPFYCIDILRDYEIKKV